MAAKPGGDLCLRKSGFFSSLPQRGEEFLVLLRMPFFLHCAVGAPEGLQQRRPAARISQIGKFPNIGKLAGSVPAFLTFTRSPAMTNGGGKPPETTKETSPKDQGKGQTPKPSGQK